MGYENLEVTIEDEGIFEVNSIFKYFEEVLEAFLPNILSQNKLIRNN